MPDSPFSADVTNADFPDQVLERSRQTPVLVDFWAAWCGPCQMLMPLLAKIAAAYQGKVFLAKVNTDVEQALAVEHGIRSLPTVKLFRDGKAVGEFMGVQPESTIRTLIDRFLPREADAVIDQAAARLRSGQTTEAVALLRTAVAQDPRYDRARIELARTLLALAPDAQLEERNAEAEKLLDGLSIERLHDPQVAALRSRLSFLRIVAEAPPMEQLERTVAADPADTTARYQLSAYRVLSDEYEPAMQQLLEIVRRDRKYGDDAGRKALVGLFALLGNDNPLVPKYRALLSSALN